MVDEHPKEAAVPGVRVEEVAAAAEELVRSAPAAVREQVAAELLAELRERVRAAGAVAETVAVDPPTSPSANPFALGIPLAMVGFLLLILFPPVGVVLVGSAVLAMVWGLVSALVPGRLRAWR